MTAVHFPISQKENPFDSLEAYVRKTVESIAGRVVRENYVSAYVIADHFDVSVRTVNEWADARKISSISCRKNKHTFRKFKLSQVEKELQSK